MAQSQLAQAFQVAPPPQVGTGRNRAIDALQDAQHQVIEGQKTTAALQAEAIRASGESAKLMAAGVKDLGAGFAQAGENRRLAEESEKQRQAAAERDRKAQAAETARQMFAQSEQSKRQQALIEANRESEERKQASTEKFNAAQKTERDLVRQMGRADLDYNSALERLSGPDIPENEAEAAEYVRLNTQIALAAARKSGRIKTDRDVELVKADIETTRVQNLTRARTAKNASLRAKNLEQVQKHMEMDTKAKNSMQPVQQQLFAQLNSQHLIDKSFAEGVGANQAAARVLTDLTSQDLSKGPSGVGIIQALLSSDGAPEGSLNKAAGKLGPAGMAATDALLQTVAAYENALGPTDDPSLQAFRTQVIGKLLGGVSKLRSVGSYNAIRRGFYMTEYLTFEDQFREQTGTFPNDQESMNYLRGLDPSFLPGDLNLKKYFAENQSAGGAGIGVPAGAAGDSLRIEGPTSTSPVAPTSRRGPLSLPPRKQAAVRQSGRSARKGFNRSVSDIGEAAVGFAEPAIEFGRNVKRGAGITAQFITGFFGEDVISPVR